MGKCYESYLMSRYEQVKIVCGANSETPGLTYKPVEFILVLEFSELKFRGVGRLRLRLFIVFLVDFRGK